MDLSRPKPLWYIALGFLVSSRFLQRSHQESCSMFQGGAGEGKGEVQVPDHPLTFSSASRTSLVSLLRTRPVKILLLSLRHQINFKFVWWTRKCSWNWFPAFGQKFVSILKAFQQSQSIGKSNLSIKIHANLTIVLHLGRDFTTLKLQALLINPDTSSS